MGKHFVLVKEQINLPIKYEYIKTINISKFAIMLICFSVLQFFFDPLSFKGNTIEQNGLYYIENHGAIIMNISKYKATEISISNSTFIFSFFSLLYSFLVIFKDPRSPMAEVYQDE
jgi:hypothetical protein